MLGMSGSKGEERPRKSEIVVRRETGSRLRLPVIDEGKGNSCSGCAPDDLLRAMPVIGCAAERPAGDLP